MKPTDRWHVIDQSDGGRYINVRDTATNRVIARVPFNRPFDPNADDHDRAMLIAKAPVAVRMAAALRAFNDAYSFISENVPAPLAHAVRKARAALTEWDAKP